MTDEPRRLTPTERLHEVTMAAMHRAPAAPESSVELSRNAKGGVQIAVTVRGGDAFTVEQDACEIFDRLTQRYPRDVDDLLPKLQASVAEQKARKAV